MYELFIKRYNIDRSLVEAALEQAVDDGRVTYDGELGGYRLPEYDTEGTEDVV